MASTMGINFSTDENGEVDFDSISIAIEDDEEVCDYCGERLGFCAMDCETLDEEFEE